MNPWPYHPKEPKPGQPVNPIDIGPQLPPAPRRDPPGNEVDHDMGQGTSTAVATVSAAAAPAGAGKGGKSYHETPVTYARPTYQLQDTHTTILPMFFNFAFTGLDHMGGVRLTINCTNVISPFTSYPAMDVCPTTGDIAKGVYLGMVPNANTWVNPRQDGVVPSATALPVDSYVQGHKFWSKMYEYYTVTKCHYTLRIYPAVTSSTKGNGYMMGQYRESFKATERLNQARPDDISLWKMKHQEGILWTEKFGISQNDGVTNLVNEYDGTYVAGSSKTNVQNDEDQKTWHKVADKPDMEETHNFVFYRQPTIPRGDLEDTAKTYRFNATLEVKYVVQYKDRLPAWRYFNAEKQMTSYDMVSGTLA